MTASIGINVDDKNNGFLKIKRHTSMITRNTQNEEEINNNKCTIKNLSYIRFILKQKGKPDVVLIHKVHVF